MRDQTLPALLTLPLRWLGRALARFLSRPRGPAAQTLPPDPALLAATLRPGDVLLIEGTSRFGEAIKYLTQSTWSHAALYIGDALGPAPAGEEAHVLLDADVIEGVRTVPLSRYTLDHTRICRPIGLSESDVRAVINHGVQRLGYQYDLRNIIDLARYLIQKPPVPQRFRRRMVALGSGDPTRAICSSLIAQCFQSIGYPILPVVDIEQGSSCTTAQCYEELLHIRHHSLYAPKDFDISPYFAIIKPTIIRGLDHRKLKWSDESITARQRISESGRE